MKTIIPSDIPAMQLQQLMQTAIAPRPIALASTINQKGEIIARDLRGDELMTKLADILK